MRVLVKLKCEIDGCGGMYYTRKNKRNTTARISLKKYCKFCRKHMVFTETK